jgi:hypothetical protein
MCHVRLSMIEHTYSRTVRGSYSLTLATHYERRLTLTQKRFKRAITTLAKTLSLRARAEVARSGAKLRAVGAKRTA